jgi:uncharacterized delta-60 repeat protein
MKYIIMLLVPFILLAQIENWIYTYNGNLNQIDVAEALTCGLDGNIYVVGRTANYGTSSDFIVASLNDNGDTNWIYLYNPMNLEDIPFAVEYGLDHNIYVAGFSSTPTTYSDFTVLSLTADGDTNWTYRHDGPGTIEDYDMACAVTYGLDGNIYAGGTSFARYGAGDFFVVSLSSAGDTNWTYRHGDTVLSAGMVRAIEYGADGNVYAVGSKYYAGSHYDFFVVSLSTAGDTNWTYSYSGALDYDAAYSVTYGLDGNIYVAGYSSEVDSLWFFTVISLTDEGDENWVFRYPSEIIYIFRPEDIIVYGLDNNIYAAGKCMLPGESGDFFVVSLSTAGDTNWTYRRDGKANDEDFANEIVYGSDGNIYAAGMICDEIRGPDFAVVSLSADGIENWVYTYSALQIYRLDEAHSIDYGSDGNIYAAGSGSHAGSFWNFDFTVVSLEPGTGVEEVKTDFTQPAKLEAMPNPFTYMTDIRYQIKDDRKNYELKVYDIAGHLVTDLSEQVSVIGHQSSVSWDGTDAAGQQVPAGVYFVKLTTGDRTATEKVLLVR